MDIERLLPRAVEATIDSIQNIDPMVALPIVIYGGATLLCFYTLWRINSDLGRLRNGKRVWMRGKMSSELRERELVADAVCDALEDLYARDQITLRARNRWYARIGKAHKLKDLIPRKKKITKNSSYAVYLRDKAARGLEALRKLSPYPIPGPKPGEDAYVKPPRKKGALFSKVRA